MTTWIQLRLTTSPEYTDACAQLLLDVECSGVQIEDSKVLFDESEDATIVARSEAVVTGYLTSLEQAETAADWLKDALQRGGLPANLSIEPVAEQDWSTTWRDNFPPLRIGSFLIVPPWEEVVPEDTAPSSIIRIDPGLAFGTGQHPTTRMCLELLSEYLRPTSMGQAPQLLDVGCGSGILSIAAARLGAAITSSDLDTFCVQATRENTAANDVAVNIVQAAGLDWTATQFNYVIANLMSALLISLATSLSKVTREDGTLIVSGISAPRAEDVEAALKRAGFVTVERRDQDGEQRGDFTERWTAFVMKMDNRELERDALC